MDIYIPSIFMFVQTQKSTHTHRSMQIGLVSRPDRQTSTINLFCTHTTGARVCKSTHSRRRPTTQQVWYHLFEHLKHIRPNRSNASPGITHKDKIKLYASLLVNLKRESNNLFLPSPVYTAHTPQRALSGYELPTVRYTWQSPTCTLTSQRPPSTCSPWQTKYVSIPGVEPSTSSFIQH